MKNIYLFSTLIILLLLSSCTAFNNVWLLPNRINHKSAANKFLHENKIPVRLKKSKLIRNLDTRNRLYEQITFETGYNRDPYLDSLLTQTHYLTKTKYKTVDGKFFSYGLMDSLGRFVYDPVLLYNLGSSQTSTITNGSIVLTITDVSSPFFYEALRADMVFIVDTANCKILSKDFKLNIQSQTWPIVDFKVDTTTYSYSSFKNGCPNCSSNQCEECINFHYTKSYTTGVNKITLKSQFLSFDLIPVNKVGGDIGLCAKSGRDFRKN